MTDTLAHTHPKPAPAPLITQRDAPPRAVWALEQAGVHPLLAKLYAGRGVRHSDELDNALGKLLPPSSMLGACASSPTTTVTAPPPALLRCAAW
jgi:hypothetical protein